MALLMYFSEAEPAVEAYFWMIGSLGRASWDNLLPASIMLVGCVIPLMWKSWDVNVMGAGDERAKSLGVNVERTRIFIMIIASLLTAGIICFTGCIGFIGLVAPHMSRMVIGGDNRFNSCLRSFWCCSLAWCRYRCKNNHRTCNPPSRIGDLSPGWSFVLLLVSKKKEGILVGCCKDGETKSKRSGVQLCKRACTQGYMPGACRIGDVRRGGSKWSRKIYPAEVYR